MRILAVVFIVFVRLSENDYECSGIFDSNCGLVPLVCETCIYHGAETNTTWPWQVLLKHQVLKSFKCGGSLIANQWILTAAHCLVPTLNLTGYLVDINIHDITNPDPWSRTNLSISKIIKHSSYDQKTLLNDIALIKLSLALTKSTDMLKAMPICIPKDSSRFYGKDIQATGWGETEKERESKVLMEVSLRIRDDGECEELSTQFAVAFNISTQLCAGKRGGDTCHGDSGGPLMSKDSQNEKWYLIGITSYGIECGKLTGVYTRVSAYYDWIRKNIKS